MKSLDELKALRDKARAEMGVREDAEDLDGYRVVVGMATCGIAAGARPVLQAIVKEVSELGLNDIAVGQTGCIGICQYEPIVEIHAPNGEKTTYINMTADKAVEVVDKHLKNGEVITEYTIGQQTK